MTLNQITKVKGPGIHTQANIVSNSISLGGIATASNFKTGTTNIHSAGVEAAGINVLGADTPIGTGATIYDAGGAVFTGVVTATSFSGTSSLASGLTGTPDIAVRNITGVGATFTGNVSIGGTLTYEDVTNIDSVGIITARNGIDCNGDLDVDGHTNLDNVSIAGVTTHNGTTNLYGNGAASVVWGDTGYTGHLTFDGSNNAVIRAASGKALIFQTNHVNERLRIASDGKIFVSNEAGTIDTTARLGEGNRFQLSGLSSNDGISVVRYNSSYGAWGLNLGRSRSNTLGTNVALQDNDDIGHVTFWGADGSDFNKAAQISAEVDGTPSDGTDMPGALVFKTSADASGTPSERLRITSIGQVLLGIDNAVDAEVDLQIHSATSGNGPILNMTNNTGDCRIFFGQDNSSGSANAQGQIRYNVASNYLSAYTAGDERLRISSAGLVGIGTATPDQTLELFKASGTNLVKVSTQANSTVGLEIEKTGSTTQSWRIADGQTVNGKLEFYDVTDSATRMCIDGAGRILINRTAQHSSSSERLSVNGMTSIQNNSTSTASLYIFNEETTTSGNPIQPFLFCHDGSGIRAALGVQRSTGLSVLNGQFGLSFRTGASALGGTEKLRITTNGRLNVGTGELDQTDRMLNVYGGRARISGIPANSNSFEVYGSSTTGQSHGILVSAGTNSSDINANFRSSGGSTLLRIRGDGNIGIGEDSPDTKLHVKFTGNGNSVLKLEPGTTAGNYGGIELGRTDGSGNVRMTTVVKGGVPISGISGIEFGSSDTNLPAISFASANTSNGHIAFKPKGTEKVRIEADGRVNFSPANNDFTNPDIGGSTAGVSINKNTAGQIYACVDDNQGHYYRNWVMNLCRRNNAGDGPQLALDRGGWVKASIGGLVGSNTANGGPGQFAIYTHDYNSGSHVQKEQLRIKDNGTWYIGRDGVGGRIYTDGSSGSLWLQSGNGRQSFRIYEMASGQSHTTHLDATGQLGIGIAPSDKLHIYHASNDPFIKIQRDTNSHVSVGGIKFASGAGNGIFATLGSRVTSNSGEKGCVYIQTQDGSNTREPLRAVGASGGQGSRLTSQGNAVCVFGSDQTHGGQFIDGRPNSNNVYEHSQSAYRNNSNGMYGGTFVVTGTGSNAGTTWYPVWFSLHTKFPQVLTLGKYVHNYATWDGQFLFRADISGTGYGAYGALHRVTHHTTSAKNFIGRIKFSTHNNAYLILWMLGGGRSYHWGTIGGGIQQVNVGDDGNNHNLGPGNNSEGPITSADTMDYGYEPNMNDSPSHQQTGFT